MPLLPVSFGLAAVGAYAAGRDLAPLFALRLRGIWLIGIALVLRVISLLPLDPAIARALFALAFWLLVGAIALNPSLPGARLMAFGVLLNALVVSINGGAMPALGGHHADDALHTRGDGTVLWWLGDLVPIPALGMYSVGDVVLAAGTVLLVLRTSVQRERREPHDAQGVARAVGRGHHDPRSRG